MADLAFQRQEYIELFGEDPVEMFGSDWFNILSNLQTI